MDQEAKGEEKKGKKGSKKVSKAGEAKAGQVIFGKPVTKHVLRTVFFTRCALRRKKSFTNGYKLVENVKWQNS